MESGDKLGRYEILEPLGAGGMGEVYRARDPRLEREVAIKLLPPEFAEDGERLARFEREAKAIAAIDHPFITTQLSSPQRRPPSGSSSSRMRTRPARKCWW